MVEHSMLSSSVNLNFQLGKGVTKVRCPPFARNRSSPLVPFGFFEWGGNVLDNAYKLVDRITANQEISLHTARIPHTDAL